MFGEGRVALDYLNKQADENLTLFAWLFLTDYIH